MIRKPKTKTLTIRITPANKELLKTIAENEDRSMASMIEIFIRNYRKQNIFDTSSAKIPVCIHGLVSHCKVFK